MEFPKFGKYQLSLIIGVASAKAFLMTITPLSLDLSYAISQTDRGPGLLVTPYGVLLRAIVLLWTHLPIEHPQLANAWTISSFQPSAALYLLVFLVKLPLLLTDFAMAILLYNMALRFNLREHDAKLAFYLWFMNPYVVITNEMLAAVDIYPTFLMLLSLAFGQGAKGIKASLAFGGSIALKLFPILLAPVLIIRGNNRRRLLLATVLGAAIYLAWVAGSGFDVWAQFTQYNMFTQYFGEYTIKSLDKVILGVLSPALVVLYIILIKASFKDRTLLCAPAASVFLVYFALGSWYPQFLIWLLPMLILDFVSSKNIRTALLMTSLVSLALVVSVLNFYSYFTANGNGFFFIPANTASLRLAVQAYRNMVAIDFVSALVAPVLRSLLAAVCVTYVLEIIRANTTVISSLSAWIRIRES
jgi:hypothetical protein